MFTEEQIDQAARLFIQARTSGTPGPRLPESCRPTDAGAAIAIQYRTLELLDEKIGGWKCGIPTPNGVMLAPITASTVTRTAPAPFPGKKATIEPEIAFVMGQDLPPRATAYTDRRDPRGHSGSAFLPGADQHAVREQGRSELPRNPVRLFQQLGTVRGACGAGCVHTTVGEAARQDHNTHGDHFRCHARSSQRTSSDVFYVAGALSERPRRGIEGGTNCHHRVVCRRCRCPGLGARAHRARRRWHD